MLVYLTYLFLMYQIRIAQPAYAQPGRCHPGTKQKPEVSLRIHSFLGVSLATYFQVYQPASFF